MEHRYLDYLREDSKLYAVVREALPDLQRLTSTQVEKLVFYLKSLHNYYPKSENHTAFCAEFADRLNLLRSSADQVSLLRQTNSALMKGIVSCMLGGAFLAVAIAAFLGGQLGVGVVFLGVAGVSTYWAASKLFHRAIETAKEQDRKYFLSSIRAASACNELDWAGLFSHTALSRSGPLSDDDLALLDNQVAELTESLRAALYNDEYFQYSSSKLSDAA